MAYIDSPSLFHFTLYVIHFLRYNSYFSAGNLRGKLASLFQDSTIVQLFD